MKSWMLALATAGCLGIAQGTAGAQSNNLRQVGVICDESHLVRLFFRLWDGGPDWNTARAAARKVSEIVDTERACLVGPFITGHGHSEGRQIEHITGTWRVMRADILGLATRDGVYAFDPPRERSIAVPASVGEP